MILSNIFRSLFVNIAFSLKQYSLLGQSVSNNTARMEMSNLPCTKVITRLCWVGQKAAIVIIELFFKC